MNLAVMWQSLPLYAHGAWITLQLLALALAIGLAAALPLAVLRSLPSPWVWRPVWCFTYVIRGTPLLVQLFLLYYGLAQFEAVRTSLLWPWLRSPCCARSRCGRENRQPTRGPTGPPQNLIRRRSALPMRRLCRASALLGARAARSKRCQARAGPSRGGGSMKPS